MCVKRKVLLPICVMVVAVIIGSYGVTRGWFSSNTQSKVDGSRSQPRPSESKYAPPEVRAPELASFVNRNGAMQDRVPSDITSRIPRVRHDEDMRVVVSLLKDTEDNDTVRNEAANLLRRSGCKQLTDVLIQVLGNATEGPRFRAFCIQHLWMNLEKADAAEKAKIMAALHRALTDKHVPVRREALLALVRERDPEAQGLAVKWLTTSEGAEVRDLAIRCVKDLDLKDQMPTVRSYLRDPNEPTRIAAIVALSQWGDAASRAAFEEAAKSKSARLQRAGKAALERLDKAKEKTQQ